MHDSLRMEQLHAASSLLGVGSVEQNLRASNLLLCMLHGGVHPRLCHLQCNSDRCTEGVGQEEVAEVRQALRALPAIVEHVGDQGAEKTRLQFLRNSLVMVVSRLAELSRTPPYPAASRPLLTGGAAADAPALAEELGMHFLSDLSQAPALSNRFFLPIVTSLAESSEASLSPTPCWPPRGLRS